MTRLVVVVERGAVREVWCSDATADVEVYDLDTQDADLLDELREGMADALGGLANVTP